jgi:hypothetical protein
MRSRLACVSRQGFNLSNQRIRSPDDQFIPVLGGEYTTQLLAKSLYLRFYFQYQLAMSTTDMRTESQQILERIDERFLAAVHALLKTYDVQREALKNEVIGYSVTTNEPILASEADDTFEGIVDDVKGGNYVDVDDLIAEKSAQW